MYKNLFPTTELAVDLKLYTRESGRMEKGVMIDGVLTRDGEDHFTFIQNALERKSTQEVKRNPKVYKGISINVHRSDDGQLYPTFNRPRFDKLFTFSDFCHQAALELLVVADMNDELLETNECLGEEG